MKIKKISDSQIEIEKEGAMRVPVRVFTSDVLFEKLKEDKSLQQGINVATLPGIQKASYIMPDAHMGYGFSIGGVAGFDAQEGIISPGGIGFDINCGVRVLATNLTVEDVRPKMHELLTALFEAVPSGVGSESKFKLSREEMDEVLLKGARWALERGYGEEEDLELTEEGGCFPDPDPSLVSPRAKKRGKDQLGTLGSGNHFLEIQSVDEIYDEEIARRFGITKTGQVVIMIHCGSRGLGHQVCSDFLRKMEEQQPELADSLPDRDLMYAPAQSQIAKDYFKAMQAAANFAFCNRQIIAHQVRKTFKEVFPGCEVKQVYDIAHNIAKLEEHDVDGVKKQLYVHRKGATRAFGPGRKEIPEKYRDIGQPILIPGSMGTASFILVGTQKAMEISMGSTAHGAGRVMSRSQAKREFDAKQIKEELAQKNIMIKSASMRGITEEAPQVYKDVDEVVKVSHEAGIGKLVVRVVPLGVVKG
ncbi:RtcB family protein [Candidatus Woesearchaeota archaeon]|nr:MAG: RtcB family protein [Candidatus Woesearchaeota archaeon]